MNSLRPRWPPADASRAPDRNETLPRASACARQGGLSRVSRPVSTPSAPVEVVEDFTRTLVPLTNDQPPVGIAHDFRPPLAASGAGMDLVVGRVVVDAWRDDPSVRAEHRN